MSDKILGYTIEEIEDIVSGIRGDAPRTREQVDLLNRLQLDVAYNEGAVRVRKMAMTRVNELRRRGNWS